MRVVITGTGVVSPVGIGNEAFWSSLASRVCGIGEIKRFHPGAYLGGEVPAAEFARVFDDRRLRRAAEVTKYAFLSAREALVCAGAYQDLFDASRAGIVSGVTHGALEYSCLFHAGVVREGPPGASPALFSDSVLNATAGTLSLAFGIKGPSHSLIGGSPVGLQAIAFAAGLIREKRVELCAATASEVLNQRAVEVYSRMGLVSKARQPSPFTKGAEGFLPGEGAGTIILEVYENATRRGARPLAEIRGWGFSCSGDLAESVATALEKALSSASLGVEDIKVVITGANGGAAGRAEGAALGKILKKGTRVVSIRPSVGEAFGAGAVMDTVAAALSVSRGAMVSDACAPVEETLSEWQWAALKPSGEPSVQDHVLISSTGLLGEAGFIILKRL